MRNRPSNQEIRTALTGRAIVGKSADLLTAKISSAFNKIEARGGIDTIGNDIAARIKAARRRLAK